LLVTRLVIHNYFRHQLSFTAVKVWPPKELAKEKYDARQNDKGADHETFGPSLENKAVLLGPVLLLDI
jgi:hypothetical protein